MRSRSATRLVAVSLTAALLLTACGDDGSSTDDRRPRRHPQPTAGGAFPATVPHKFGETVVPEAPERVVSVGLTEQDTLLQLGVMPVAVTEWYGEQPHATWPWAHDLLGDAEPEVLSQSDGIEFEKIAALEPDLIVGTNAGLTEKDYELLSAIAPTVTSVEGSDPVLLAVARPGAAGRPRPRPRGRRPGADRRGRRRVRRRPPPRTPSGRARPRRSRRARPTTACSTSTPTG